MTAVDYDITVEAGTTWNVVITLYDSSDDLIDLTDYTARMMVRPTHDSPIVYVNLTSGSGITLGGVAGTITLERTATQTSAFKFSSGVYDLEIQKLDGTVTRVLSGQFIVLPEVTR